MIIKITIIYWILNACIKKNGSSLWITAITEIGNNNMPINMLMVLSHLSFSCRSLSKHLTMIRPINMSMIFPNIKLPKRLIGQMVLNVFAFCAILVLASAILCKFLYLFNYYINIYEIYKNIFSLYSGTCLVDHG